MTDNVAESSGGGIALVNTSVLLRFATVVGNEAPVGAAIELQAGSDSLISFASVVGGDGPGTDCAIDPGAVTTSLGANVDRDASCGFGAGTGDRPAAGDPGLGALADNGGPTPTRLPQTGSLLIDAADCLDAPFPVPTDQRLVARPQGARCDIGAVEVVPPPPPPGPPPVDPPGPTPAPPAVPVPGPARFTG